MRMSSGKPPRKPCASPPLVRWLEHGTNIRTMRHSIPVCIMIPIYFSPPPNAHIMHILYVLVFTLGVWHGALSMAAAAVFIGAS